MTTNWSADKRHSERERWVCVYPAYINSKKSLAEGRRVPKDKGVENPTCQEIRDVLAAAGMKIGVECKLYPRERSRELTYLGRIRVQLKNDNGSPCNPEFPDRDSVFLYCCNTIPKLKSRVGGKAGGQEQAQGSSGGAKKKGKGRR